MKVVVINSRYFPSAGPEKYLFSISSLLTQDGHTVVPFALKHARNTPSKYEEFFAKNIGPDDAIYYEQMDRSFRTKIEILDRQFYSLHVRRKLEQLIRSVRPDYAYILHHQNRLSPSVIDACNSYEIPTVLRISDFSLVCTRNNLLRDGNVCELCIDNSLLEGVKNRCVKNSYSASLIKAAALAAYRIAHIYEKVDMIAVPSRFTMEKLSSVLEREKMVYLPTVVESSNPENDELGAFGLFVGRIEEEKGLAHAIEACASVGYPLKIVGFSHTGYGERLQSLVRSRGWDSVEFLGAKFGPELDELYRTCRFAILPVIWYENLPNVALEAMSHGKPVITSDIGSMPEVVIQNETGLLCPPGDVDSLRSAVVRISQNPELTRSLGKAGREHIRKRHAPDVHLRALKNVFESARENRARR